MTEPSEPPSRHLVWSGLAAGCSMCGWTRNYHPGLVVHRLPNVEVEKAIRSEYVDHKCGEFPPR